MLRGIKIFTLVFFLSAIYSAMAQSKSPPVPTEWQTLSERTNYQKTPRYNETIEYARRLDSSSPLIRYTTFGKSGDGRDLPLLIAAKDGHFTPPAAHKAGKAVILIQACIHSGESDGKDAGLALLRDIAITKTIPGLLDHVVLLFIPIYNTDGHERFGAYNRINQNGPAEMGWRTTGINLDLNRDYMKADAPETRGWLKLWTEWNPDLFIDCHVTDGADYAYSLTYHYLHDATVPGPVLEWERMAFDSHIIPGTEKDGNLVNVYLEFRDNRDLMKGVEGFIPTPRYSTGYAPARNRPGLLIETHMLKDYRSRVRGTYDLLRRTLEEVNRDPQALLRSVAKADQETIQMGSSYDALRKLPLSSELTDKSNPLEFKGVEYKIEKSEISGTDRVIYGTDPLNLTIPFYDETRVTASAAPPLYYIIPPQYKNVISVLVAHGLKLKQLAAPATIEVESYRFSDAAWAPRPFEGRLRVSYKSNLVHEKRKFEVGSVVVPMAQPAARVALYLLEPASPDSLLSWGFFNSIFEQKEYAESYVLEKLAREMIRKNPALKEEFEKRVAAEAAFASNPSERLRFFYERSPHWDAALNLYPIGRITAQQKELEIASDGSLRN